VFYMTLGMFVSSRMLCGLKQAPHAWFEKFSIVISSLGFVSNSHDSALLLSALMQVILLCLYMLMI